MGGMLAARYALQYPLATGHLVLVNPIGLEDWRAEGVPWRNVDAWYAGQLKTGYDRSEEHTSELQSLMRISYAVFCLKKKKYSTHHAQHEIISQKLTQYD